MIALKKEWLVNLRIQNEAEKYRTKGYISQAEFDVVHAKYPVGFYMPNVFVRLGLFILTFFIVLVADGLMSMIVSEGGGDILESPGCPLFLSVLSYISLEALIATKYHFRSGVDDALLLATGLLSAFAIVSLVIKLGIGEDTHSQWIAFGTFIFALYFTIRFNDILMAAACCCSFLTTIFFAWNNAGFGGLYTAPFVIVVVSAGVYWLTTKLSAAKKYVDYEGCLLIGRTLSLVALYAAGNYYIVQTLGGELNPGQLDKPLPLGTFFWSWTMLIPFAYLMIGIRKKDAIFLRLGSLLIVAAVATFRNYYHILPTDAMLTIAGILVTGVSWAIIWYLKTPKHGFTYEEAGEESILAHSQIESIITAQSVAGITATPPASGSRFGGGDGGGGGASGSF